MAIRPLDHVLCRLRGLALPCDDSDERLLERFLTQREEGAFAALLRRHGPMVWGVCRRLLPCPHDAEDAFQATFLILVRKAASVVPRGRVGNWLYGVAYRTALAARTTAARRATKERQALRAEAVEPPDNEFWELLDAELCRLPDRYRECVVLCDLEGRTRKEAAQQLGWSEGTLSGRLARARALLAQRLTRRGVTPGALVAAALAQAAPASAALPGTLFTTTLQTAVACAAGSPAVPARVAALTTGVLQTMSVGKVKLIAAVLVLTLGLVLLGRSSLADHPGQTADPAPAQKTLSDREDPPQPPEPQDEALSRKRMQDLDDLLEKHFLRQFVTIYTRQPRGQLVETEFIVKSIEPDLPLVTLTIADTELTVLAVRVAPDAQLQLYDGKKMKMMKYADLKPGMRVSIWVETKKGKSVIVGLTAFRDADAKARMSGAAALQELGRLLREGEDAAKRREQVRRIWLDMFGELPPPEAEYFRRYQELMERARQEWVPKPEKQ
jgi:RNA polymerase sigma factor (sigma-70 family)